MSQATVTATTDVRRLVSALRPLMLLGGFVLVWWFLMMGTAQADDGPGRGLADTARQATGSVERAVDQQVRRPAPADKVRQHRGPVTQVTTAVRRHVAPVTSSVTTPVATVAEQTVENDVKPLTTRTTDTVRSTVHKVVKDVGSNLENGPAVLPELHSDKVDVPPLLTGESSIRVGETRSNGHSPRHFGVASSVLPNGGVADLLETQVAGPDTTADTIARAHQDKAVPAPAGGDDRDGAVAPVDPDGASSGPSGSAGSGAPGDIATGLVIAPATTNASTPLSADRLPAGPTYSPGSSPD